MQECCVKNNAIEVIWVGWSSLYKLLERLFFAFHLVCAGRVKRQERCTIGDMANCEDLNIGAA